MKEKITTFLRGLRLWHWAIGGSILMFIVAIAIHPVAGILAIAGSVFGVVCYLEATDVDDTDERDGFQG